MKSSFLLIIAMAASASGLAGYLRLKEPSPGCSCCSSKQSCCADASATVLHGESTSGDACCVGEVCCVGEKCCIADAPSAVKQEELLYYVIWDGSGEGDSIRSFPIQSSERVGDVLAKLGDVSQFNGKEIWIARPAPDGIANETILPVKTMDIRADEVPATDQEVLPGDRIFISALAGMGEVLKKRIS